MFILLEIDRLYRSCKNCKKPCTIQEPEKAFFQKKTCKERDELNPQEGWMCNVLETDQTYLYKNNAWYILAMPSLEDRVNKLEEANNHECRAGKTCVEKAKWCGCDNPYMWGLHHVDEHPKEYKAEPLPDPLCKNLIHKSVYCKFCKPPDTSPASAEGVEGILSTFDDLYGSFQLCEVVNKKDHTNLRAFINTSLTSYHNALVKDMVEKGVPDKSKPHDIDGCSSCSDNERWNECNAEWRDFLNSFLK